MMLAATENSTAIPTTMIVLLVGSTLVSFGYLKAKMDRANDDYKKVKAGLPGMRKDFWRAWWAAVKIGALVFVAAVVLVTWVVHDVRQADADTPRPSSPARMK